MVDTTTVPAHTPASGLSEGSTVQPETEAGSGVASRPKWLGAAVALLIAVGIALRCWTPVALWLDEALSVNIARLPLGSIPEALRHDGSPPLYYFLLHGWMRLFGTGDVAVRAFSAVLSVATLVPMWFAGRRAGNRTTAWAAVVLLAASPFAIRFATEARMYALVMLECVLGYLALCRALERPGSKTRLAAVALVTALLLLSHYWTMYLLAVVGVLLAHRALRGADPVSARRALGAMAGGVLLFMPWLPSFLFQLRHTGTPWARRPSFEAVVDVIQEFGGGRGAFAAISALFLIGLACLGLFARPLDGRHLEVDVRTRPRGRALALAAVGPVLIGVVVGILTGAAFAARYAAMAVPPFVLLAALGTDALADPKVRRWVLAVIAVLGLWTGASTSLHRRTTARQVSTAIKERGSPGDVVAYCPDQLGPSVSRYLPDQFVQVTFPRGLRPERVEWVDYEETNREAEARLFAEAVLERAGPNDVWMVWSPGYRTFDAKCEAVIEALEVERPLANRLVRVQLRYWEHPGLVRFRPGSLTSGGPREPLVIPTPSSPR
ncbi:MAG: glycosyltransferase family 39 protein [Actinomycetota bacterium]|nr:glycosyltransferase family 39 protein [Actinomycetota bacterium]